MEDFEITKREILFSTIIICVMIGLGVWISNPVLRSASESAMNTVSSVKVYTDEQFSYIRRTNVGDFLAEGTLSAINPVHIDDISGEYLKIEKEKEKYTQHVRHYTTTDGKGHVHHHTQVYYSWDHVHTDTFCVDSVEFLGERFKLDDVGYHVGLDYKETQKESMTIRYVYRVHPVDVDGVMFGKCEEKEYKNLSFNRDRTIEKVVASAERRIKSAPIVFWVLWILLTAGLVMLFYHLENNWLED